MENKWILKKANSKLHLARHITLDYYWCNNNILSDSWFLENTLIESAKAIWATVITSNFHNFKPQWVSWVVILSESHFTIHSWPEYWYAAVDMFACWDMQFEKWIEILRKTFQSKKVNKI
jgi:S-adenosylmethionine decarboxylase proenzyme